MKLFGKGGKFNIIDVIVVVLVLAVAAFIFLAPSLNETEENEISETSLSCDITIDIVCKDVDEVLAQSVQQSLNGPDVVLDGNAIDPHRICNGNKLVDAEIVECEYTDGNLYFTIKGTATVTNGNYQFGTQYIRIGRDYIIKTIEVELNGIVCAMEMVQ